MVDYFSAALTGVLAPSQCAFCGQSLVAGTICTACEHALPWNVMACPGCALPQSHSERCAACQNERPAFDSAWTAFRFAPPIQQNVHALKYHAGFHSAQLLGELMAQRLLRRPQPLPQLIMPVPLHVRRLQKRGYNQALELGRVISRQTGIACTPDRALRLRNTEDQIGKTAAQRRRNLRKSFAVTGDLKDLHIALLDDVMTTGATLEELARVCRKAGAARIEAWAIARVA